MVIRDVGTSGRSDDFQATTVCCGQRPQHFRNHREAIHGLRPLQFIVTEGHNILEVKEIICGLRPQQLIVALLPDYYTISLMGPKRSLVTQIIRVL